MSPQSFHLPKIRHIHPSASPAPDRDGHEGLAGRLSAGLVVATAFAAVMVLAGCASGKAPTKSPAPVEERNAGSRTARSSQAEAKASKSSGAGASASAGQGVVAAAELPPRPLPGIENAGKPGYYTVKPGDTVIRIGIDNNQSWHDIVRWNGLENPNVIEVGQVLRVVPPAVDAGAVVSRGVAPARAEARPLDAKPAPALEVAATVAMPAASAPTAVGGAAPAAAAAPPSAASATATPAAAAASTPVPARETEDTMNWAWPSSGPVGGQFEEGRTRGLVITGKAGDPVLAAADGRVIYAGSALRGYGNLIIVKHNATYLTAYAHNQALLVKEDQRVRRGQRIAEMGATDAERVQLHFEIRRQGKPIDPLQLLPPR